MNESKHGYDWEPVTFNQRSPEVEIRYGDTRCDTLNLTRPDLREMQSAIGLEGLEEDDIDVAIDAFQADMQRQIRSVILRRMQEWQKKYPKRSLAFMDAMGATMLHVTRTVKAPNGDTTYDVTDWHKYGAFSSWRTQKVFEPLVELVEWYNEISDTTSIGISDILVGEPFWPIHVKNSGHFEVDPRDYDTPGADEEESE